MFKFGDKVVYNRHPEAQNFGEYLGSNIDGVIFMVENTNIVDGYVVISGGGFEYYQRVDPLNLTLVKGEG